MTVVKGAVEIDEMLVTDEEPAEEDVRSQEEGTSVEMAAPKDVAVNCPPLACVGVQLRGEVEVVVKVLDLLVVVMFKSMPVDVLITDENVSVKDSAYVTSWSVVSVLQDVGKSPTLAVGVATTPPAVGVIVSVLGKEKGESR